MRSIEIVSLLGRACLPLLVLGASPTFAQPSPANWTAVDQALGRPGITQPDGVRRYGFARSDLHVVLDGVTIKPALALGGWVALQPMGSKAALMGDLVLTQEEVNPVMGELLRNGLNVTAVHNHLLRSAPSTVYMHVEGTGDPVRLATALRAGLALSHTPLVAPASPVPATPTPTGLDTAAINQIMGKAGKANGGVYQLSFPRIEMIVDNGMTVPASMGTATAINFQPVGAGRAAVTGDFVLLGSEVGPVIRELRDQGIEVTALHSHMIGETPRLYFMHFWSVGPTAKLATGLRAAVDRTNVKH